MHSTPNDKILAEIHSCAVSIAREAGQILSSYFGQNMNVCYKDENKTDPVTKVDIEVQRFVIESINKTFGDHYVLSEEAYGDEIDEEIDNDFVWVVDPLDGTKNFVAGIPIFACSIGVLYKGVPVAAAIYIPWPDGLGKIVHARSGSGAFIGDKKVSISSSEHRSKVSLSGVPANFFSQYQRPLSTKISLVEPRITGSIAYGLAMVAMGTMKYAFINGPYLWDIAGGTLIVQEAGRLALKSRIQRTMSSLFLPKFTWEPIDKLTDDGNETKVKTMRTRWTTLLAFGDPGSIGELRKLR